MSFVINTNVGAVVTSKNLVSNQREMDRVAERLSSGKKTIYASDDAAGVAILEKWKHKLGAFQQEQSMQKMENHLLPLLKPRCR